MFPLVQLMLRALPQLVRALAVVRKLLVATSRHSNMMLITRTHVTGSRGRLQACPCSSRWLVHLENLFTAFRGTKAASPSIIQTESEGALIRNCPRISGDGDHRWTWCGMAMSTVYCFNSVAVATYSTSQTYLALLGSCGRCTRKPVGCTTNPNPEAFRLATCAILLRWYPRKRTSYQGTAKRLVMIHGSKLRGGRVRQAVEAGAQLRPACEHQ